MFERPCIALRDQIVLLLPQYTECEQSLWDEENTIKKYHYVIVALKNED